MALIIVVLRLQTRMELLERTTRQRAELTDLAATSEAAISPGWPAESLIQPGQKLPPPLISHSVQGRATLFVLVKAECETCRHLLDQLPAAASLLGGYPIVVVSDTESVSSLPFAAATVTENVDDGTPKPCVLLADDQGFVQGCGLVSSIEDLAVFIHEAREHGL